MVVNTAFSIYAGPHLPGFHMGAPLGPTKSGVPKFRLTHGGLQVAVPAVPLHVGKAMELDRYKVEMEKLRVRRQELQRWA